MKRAFLVLINIVLLHTVNAQNYESIFGSESTQWNMTIGNLWGIGSTEHHVIGDTIIDNKAYKIVNGYTAFDDIKGFVRQDSTHSKAWYRTNVNPNEYLIMDLNLDIGDSLFIGGAWNSDHKFYKVDSIYTSNNRKHIRFDYDINLHDVNLYNVKKFTLIEGVVSNMGFRYQDNDFINSLPTILLCAYKNDIQIYKNGNCTISANNDIEKTKRLRVLPNPFTDAITIQSENNDKNLNLVISDVTGKIIMRKNSVINGQKIVLDRLKDGLYFLTLSNNNDIFLQSFKITKVSYKR